MCVARCDELFEEHVGDAERRAGFAPRLIERRLELIGRHGDAHAAAAAAHRRLDDDRVAELLASFFASVIGPDRRRRCRTGRHARLLGDSPGRDLVAELFEDLGPRADERDARLAHMRGRSGVLGQETVAGMNGIDADCSGKRDDAGDVEVGADRFAGLADAVGLVRLEAVQGEAVLVRVDGDGADAEFVGRAEDADGDFAAIGDEQFANGFRYGFNRHGVSRTIASHCRSS